MLIIKLDKNMEKNENIPLPIKNKIKDMYEGYTKYFEYILHHVQAKLEQTISLTPHPTYKARIKSFDSYYKKIIRLKAKEAASTDALVCLTDIIGIRVICGFLEDLPTALEQIRKIFVIDEIENKAEAQTVKEFGYDSIHVLVEIPDDCYPQAVFFPDGKEVSIPENLVCEIQIRTILQDAWAEVEHELIYKGEFSPIDMPLRRKLASINASLSLADIIFQEIRDYQNKLQSEVQERRFTFYKTVDEKSGGLAETPKKLLPVGRVSPYVQGTIDELILEAMHAHNAGNLERAITIYTQIIEAEPTPPNAVISVIRKHRGMAYFTQNDYEHALDDFKQSSHLDPRNFRSVYYEGIVYAILQQYEKAVECYTKSIAINEFHSHTFFRRAMAYYELDDYEHALNDVISAQKLGMDDSECRALHQRLIKKLDMEV